MKDDFLKRHWRQPDPQFVDRLSHKLTLTQPRSTPMFKNRILRPILLVSLALVMVAALTLAFSPVARAAVQAIFIFNGVTVSIDDETGNLVTSGNPEAIIEQDENHVTIQGENGEMAGVGVARALESEMVDVNELLIQNPELTLPNTPVGYTIEPQGQLMGDGGMVFTWKDAAENIIIFLRSPNPPLSMSTGNLNGSLEDGEQDTFSTDGSVSASGGTAFYASGSSSGGTTAPETGTTLVGEEGQLQQAGGDGLLMVDYSWEADGYFYMLLASDNNLSEADLQAMLP
jgi:hypothetical protein